MCGTELVGEYIARTSYPKCPTGHYTYYPSQSVGAAGIIFDQGKILLERRAINPGYGLWALPGGMAEQNEEIEDCLVREIHEETGLKVKINRLLDVKGGKKVCIVFYEVSLVGGTLNISEESLELNWFKAEDIPFDLFAFPRQKEILKKWLSNELD
jgi:8-oxo-dGTP diphosphatase